MNDAIKIPKNLDEAIEEVLANFSSDETTLWLRLSEQTATADAHFFGGRWLRNTWGLWHKSVLAEWFIERGITHADDMSGIILTSTHRRLNGKPILLEQQIMYYQNYWKTMGFPNGLPK